MSTQLTPDQQGRATSEMTDAESWTTRWYTPLVALGVAVLLLLLLALAVVEVLVANAPEVDRPGAWLTPLERADVALSDGDVAQALAWWREAHEVALRNGQWDGLIEVGNASRRLGARGGFRRDGDALARDAYLTALLQARRQHSLAGVLRAADALGSLGDQENTAHALRVAQAQAGNDPHAQERVRRAADRWHTLPRRSAHPFDGGQP
jgi:hypothetical protein